MEFDRKKILSYKLNFIKNYLNGVRGRQLSLSFEWFCVSEPTSEKDYYGKQSFRFINLFKEFKDEIIKELEEVNISVEITSKMYIFKMC